MDSPGIVLSFGERSIMRSVSFLAAVGFATFASLWGHSTGYAQEESREERYFRYLDRDGDGKIGREELQNLDDRMKERFKEAGLDPNQEVSRDRFMDGMRKRNESRDREREREGGAPRPAKGGKPAPKPRVTMALTGSYVPLDKNGDQQIGLYEWDAAKRAEFLALDRNGDGFLTARELDDPPKAVTSNLATVAGTPTAAPAAGALAATTVKAVPAAPGATESPASSETKDSPEVTRAKYFFSLTDKNKDGQISNEEWTGSRGVRSMFEKGKLTPTLPMSQADFIPQFQSLQKKSGS